MTPSEPKAPDDATSGRPASPENIEALRLELDRQKQAAWEERLKALRLERELDHLKNRPAVRLINALSRQAWLTSPWIALYRMATGTSAAPVTPASAPPSQPLAQEAPPPLDPTLAQEDRRRSEALGESGGARVNVIVPIHGQLDATRACLESVAKYSAKPYRILLIDDASDRHVADWLDAFAKEHSSFLVLRNPRQMGFLASANRGLAAAPDGDLILLNNDAIVTPGWLERLACCARSDARIAAISPLAAGSSTNLRVALNPGDSILDAAEKIAELSPRAYPDVVTPEGWCLYIRREVLDNLGLLDPIYGRGYCEESDWCMRALAAGYRLACCDDLLIYHQGQATFQGARGPAYDHNRQIFDQRWAALFQEHHAAFKARDPLAGLRARYAALAEPAPEIDENKLPAWPLPDDPDALARECRAKLDAMLAQPGPAPERPRVVFVVEKLEPSGGMTWIVHLVNDMILAGRSARVVVLHRPAATAAHELGLLVEPICLETPDALERGFPAADWAIGTFWRTMPAIARLFLARPEFRTAYFVQDYEPYFYDDPASRRQAVATYRMTPSCFARSPWIAGQTRTDGGRIDVLPPSLDLDVFYPRRVARLSSKKTILTLMRPDAPRRGWATLVKTLALLTERRPDVEIHGFGATDEELARQWLPFPLVNHGRVPNRRLPELYSAADVFAEFSDFHGFGLTLAEAMACGAACVATDSGGVRAFAVSEENCLMSEPGDATALENQLCRILDDDALRLRLGANGLAKARRMDRRAASEAVMRWLDESWNIRP